MKIRVKSAEYLRTTLKTFEDFMDEVSIEINRENFMIAGIDPSRVVMIKVSFPLSFFEEYDVKDEASIGIKLEEITKVLSRASKRDEIEMQINEDTINLSIKGDYDRGYILPITEASVQKLPELTAELPFRAKISPQVFEDVIDRLSEIGESIIFHGKDRSLIAKSESELISYEVILDLDSGTLLEAEGSEALSSFSSEFINKISKLSSISDIVTINLGNNMPCKLEFEMARDGKGVVYVAPKIE
jgi:proliferating cell nuclear antigen